MRISALLALVTILAFSLPGHAQSTSGSSSSSVYIGDGYHSSTAAEGALRGMGALVRSQGQYNLDTSAAAINMTEAQSNYIENRQQATNAYFDMRATNRAARAAEAGPKPTMEDAIRYAQAGRPQPLSPSDLDPVTGKINWTGELMEPPYATQRTELDQLFAQRAQNGGIGGSAYARVQSLIDKMLEILKSNITSIPPEQYTFSRNFLTSLAYTARMPTG